MSGRVVHVSLDIRGAMRWSKRQLGAMFLRPDGSKANATEAWTILADELAKGHKVLPMGECDGFSPIDGCPGHDACEAAAVTHTKGQDR